MSDVQRAASSGSIRQARPRMFGALVHGKDRSIVHWGRRGIVGWGRGVGVVGRRMGRGRAPR